MQTHSIPFMFRHIKVNNNLNRSFSILLKQFQCLRNSILTIYDLDQVVRVLLDPRHSTEGPIKLPPSVRL